MADLQANTNSPPQAAGYLLSKYGVLALLAGLVLAAWNGQVVIVILLGLAVSAAAMAKLWSRLSLEGVQCQRTLSEQRVFPGERIEMKWRLTNRKLLPLPWVQVDDEIPVAFAPDSALTPTERPGIGLLSNGTSLLWYTGVRWKHTLQCRKRGYYQLGPARLTSGDIFGFYPRLRSEPAVDHVIVYPKLFSIQELGIPSMYPIGDTRAERRIFEDPTRVIGVRDYTPHDSLRRIHWKATARRQDLQVKVFEPTTTLSVAIFLAIDSFAHGDAAREEDFELGISAAASVANYISGQGSAAGLFVNTRLADSVQSARIPPGSGPGQMSCILESLAKVTEAASGPFEEFVQQEQRALPWGTTLLFVVSTPSLQLLALLENLRERGHKLLVLQVGETGKGHAVPCVPWHNIRAKAGAGHGSTVEAA